MKYRPMLGIAKTLLDDEEAGDEAADQRPGHRDDRNQRGTEDVHADHSRPAQTFGTRRADVIAAEHLDGRCQP
jgi:hypothetical protein